MYRFCVLFFLILFFILPSTVHADRQPQQNKKVLLLHSYHAGYKWTDDITTIIQQNFTRNNGIDLRIEYLDTKRFYSSDYLDSQKDFLYQKYHNQTFDLIICSDNNALSFLLKNRGDLFTDIPIVFCGINYFNKEMLQGQSNITGVNEAVDIKKNIDLILDIHPHAERIIAITDESVTGKILYKELQTLQDNYQSVDWVFPKNQTFKELQTYLKSLSPNDIVLLGLYFRDNTGEYFEYDQVARVISSSTPTPTYVLWDFYLGYGVVGGYLASAKYQAQKALEIAHKILQGRLADDIPIILKSPNRYLADYTAMEKFYIPRQSLPSQTIIHNQPVDFYDQHKISIWIFGILFILLCFLSLFLSVNIIKKKRAENDLIALQNDLKQRVQKRTQELSIANTEIANREEQIQNLLSNVSSMIYRCTNDKSRTMIFVSSGAFKLTGYDVEDITENPDFSYSALIDPRDADRVWETIQKAITQRTKFTVEYRITTADNRSKWVWEQGRVVHNNKGKVLCLDGNITDISEKKKNEQEQKKLVTVIEQTDDLVVVTDLKSRVEYVNPAFEKITGYTNKDVVGKNPTELLKTEISHHEYKKMWLTLRQGETWRGQVTNHKKDGSPYIADVTISPIRGEQGDFVNYVGVQQDVTEQKKSEQEQKKLVTIVQQTDDIVVITDLSGRIEYVNPAFEKITGYSSEETLGKNPRVLKSGRHPEELYKTMWSQLLRGEAWHGQLTNKRKDGSEYIAEVNISPIKDQDGIVQNFVGVQRDITHKLELEKNLRQAQKLEAIGTLAGGIAHEVNTPAQFVGSNINFIKESCDDIFELITSYKQTLEKARTEKIEESELDKLGKLEEEVDLEYCREELPVAIEQSLEGIGRITKIVLAMKEFSHPSTKDQALNNINNLIETTVTVSSNEWKHIADLQFTPNPHLPMVTCCANEISQVFLILIVNAAHAIADKQENPATESIKISSKFDDEWIEIHVTDSALGIPESIQNHIFDPFFTTKEVGKGTGQGLSIAYDIVRTKHNGELYFETVEGQGTTFIIKLPIQVSPS